MPANVAKRNSQARIHAAREAALPPRAMIDRKPPADVDISGRNAQSPRLSRQRRRLAMAAYHRYMALPRQRAADMRASITLNLCTPRCRAHDDRQRRHAPMPSGLLRRARQHAYFPVTPNMLH